MSLRRDKNPMRRGKFNMVDRMRDDIILMSNDGDTITFEWKERVGATWNEIYEVWEGGTVTLMTEAVKGVGKVVDYAEDEMEYEWGRVAVGDALIRFPYDYNIEKFNDKEELRFVYKGQRWRPDSELGIGDWKSDQLISKILKGVKSLD